MEGTHNAYSRRAGTAALVLALATGCGRAGAEPLRDNWGTLRVSGVAITPLGDDEIAIWNECGGWLDWLDFEAEVFVERTAGISGSFEYVFKRRYGIEVALTWWYDVIMVDYRAEDLRIEGSPNFILPTLGANYHFFSDGRKDFYAGGFFTLGVLVSGIGFDMELESDWALGLNAGMDYAVSGPWTLGITLKYIDFGTLDFSILPPGLEGLVCDNGGFGVGNLNFLSATAGIGFRF